MQQLTVYDTFMYSDNIGDAIIMEAVYKAIAEIFPEVDIELSRTHQHKGDPRKHRQGAGAIGLVGGTNILASNMLMQPNWYLTPADLLRMRNLVLMGVGWRDYRTTLWPLTSYFYKKVLSSQYLHAVRDMHTYRVLSAIIPNVIFTSCPTLWSMTPQKCASVPVRKGKKAVLALTYYEPNAELDFELYRIVRDAYEHVYLWPQQHEDERYAREIGIKHFELIPPLIGNYKSLLESEDVDVIGSRLHGGIYALAHGRRSLILAVDVRAREMANGIGLPVIERHELDRVRNFINNPVPLELTLPMDGIAQWKAQFQSSRQEL